MTELKITQADIDRAHEWMRGQTTGLRMMLTKPRGIYEMLAAHRITAEEGIIAAIEQMYDNGDSIDGLLVNNDLRAALARVRGEG